MISVEVVVHYSVEQMDSVLWMLISVWTFAEHDGLVSVEQMLEERMMSLVLVVVVDPVHLVLVVWEERV